MIEKLNETAKKNEVSSIWFSGNSEIKNRNVNILARKGARMPSTLPEPFCVKGKNTFEMEIERKDKAERRTL